MIGISAENSVVAADRRTQNLFVELWEEQDRLFALLPPYLRRMALFKVSTGLRDQEVCRLVALNDIAQQVIAEVRGQHPVYVFTGADGQSRISRMSNKAWNKARRQASLSV